MDEPQERERSSSEGAPSTAPTTPEATEPHDNDDIWASDNDHESNAATTGQQSREDLPSDLPTVKRQHMTDGYREGLSVGKAKVMQNGFDSGYPIGVSIALRAGKILGCLEGVVAIKDLNEETRAPVKKMLEQARQDLAVSSLLRDMTDETIMESSSIPDSVEIVLRKWEKVTFGVGEESGESES